MASLAAQLWIPGKLPGLNDLIAAAKGARGPGVEVTIHDYPGLVGM